MGTEELNVAETYLVCFVLIHRKFERVNWTRIPLYEDGVITYQAKLTTLISGGSRISQRQGRATMGGGGAT